MKNNASYGLALQHVHQRNILLQPLQVSNFDIDAEILFKSSTSMLVCCKPSPLPLESCAQRCFCCFFFPSQLEVSSERKATVWCVCNEWGTLHLPPLILTRVLWSNVPRRGIHCKWRAKILEAICKFLSGIAEHSGTSEGVGVIQNKTKFVGKMHPPPKKDPSIWDFRIFCLFFCETSA